MACRFRLPVASLALATLLLGPALGFAAEPAVSAHATTDVRDGAPRFTLKSSSTDAAPQQSGRYTLRARFAPEERAGELREGSNFSLIGRFAKGSFNCGPGGVIFSSGFEGN